MTSFQSYFLHAIALEVNTQEEIAHLLGVDAQDLTSPGASLLQMDFVEQGDPMRGTGRPLFLTEKGRQALSIQGAPPVTKRKVGQFHFNALTQTSMPLEGKTYSVEQMQKEGLFILPVEEHKRPTLGHFAEKDVTEALATSSAFRGNDIVALLELIKAEIEYIAPVTVVLLQHRETSDQRLAVYRNSMLQRPESAALQHFFDEGVLNLPQDATPLKENYIDIPSSLPPVTAQMTRDLVQNEFTLEELEAQLLIQEERRTLTQSERERQELTERVQHLKEELRVKREETEKLRQRLLLSQVEFLQTEQHRPVLEQALREAQKEIIIISPWMNRKACNEHLCQLIAQALARGVRIRIGYGMGRERNTAEAERNSFNVRAVQNALRRHIPEASEHLLEIQETNGTHQKILICDQTFAVTGSFNWLSYVGERDDGYRNELGTLFRRSNEITELTTIAQRVLSSS